MRLIQLESICEDAVAVDRKQNQLDFIPALRSGVWSHIGGRDHMEDTHICIGDLAKKFGSSLPSDEVISFYGVSYLTYLILCCLYPKTIYIWFFCKIASLK